MNTAAKSTAAMYKTTATSWKRSATDTVCGATRPLEIKMVTSPLHKRFHRGVHPRRRCGLGFPENQHSGSVCGHSPTRLQAAYLHTFLAHDTLYCKKYC